MLKKLIVSIILLCAFTGTGASDDASICLSHAGCPIDIITGYCPDCVGANELPVAGLIYGKVKTSIVTAIVGRERIYEGGELDITLFNGVYRFRVSLNKNNETIEYSSSTFRRSDLVSVLDKVTDWHKISHDNKLILEKDKWIVQSTPRPEWYIYFGGAYPNYYIVFYLWDEILMFDISDVAHLKIAIVKVGELEEKQRNLISTSSNTKMKILVDTLLK